MKVAPSFDGLWTFSFFFKFILKAIRVDAFFERLEVVSGGERVVSSLLSSVKNYAVLRPGVGGVW